MAAKKTAVTAFVALWTSAEDMVDKIDLDPLRAHPRNGWSDPEIDQAEIDLGKAKGDKPMVERLADTIDAALAVPPDATHGSDCYILTAVKATLGARYEDGWVKRIEAYAKASGWTGVDLEDPAAVAAAPPPPAPAAAAAPSSATRPLPGQSPPAEPVVPTRPTITVDHARVAMIFGRVNVQRFFATLLAAFARGDMAAIDRGRANLDLAVNERLLGDDGVQVLKLYIDIRRETHLTIRMTPVELHAALGLNPP